MKIRKLVALFLCLAMICSFFVACGSAEKAPKTESPAEQSAAQSGADAVEEAVGKLDGTGLKIGLSQQHLVFWLVQPQWPKSWVLNLLPQMHRATPTSRFPTWKTS